MKQSKLITAGEFAILSLISIILIFAFGCQSDDDPKKVSGDWSMAINDGGYVEFSIAQDPNYTSKRIPAYAFFSDSSYVWFYDPQTQLSLHLNSTTSSQGLMLGKTDINDPQSAYSNNTNYYYGFTKTWGYGTTDMPGDFTVTFTSLGKNPGEFVIGDFSGKVYAVKSDNSIDISKTLDATGHFNFQIK